MHDRREEADTLTKSVLTQQAEASDQSSAAAASQPFVNHGNVKVFFSAQFF